MLMTIPLSACANGLAAIVQTNCSVGNKVTVSKADKIVSEETARSILENNASREAAGCDKGTS